MKHNHKISKTALGGYNYRGWNVYGKNRAWIMYNEDGYIAWTFKTLKEFTDWIDKNFKKLSKSA
jgi:hypothetical protein